MFLSVIIPTYNRAEYLKKCLASLTKQTWLPENFEVLVVDDGGVDNTAAVIAEFTDKLSLKYFKELHQGVCHARNVGIKNASGEILVFFDDDAVAASDWLEKIVAAMTTESIIVGRGRPQTDNLWQYFAPHYDRGEKSLYLDTIWECNLAVKKNVFDEVGLFNEIIDWGHEGNEFARRVSKKYQIAYRPEVVIYHDYAFGLINYLSKQKKFGEKLIYLKKEEIKGLGQIFFGYDKLKKISEITIDNQALEKLPIFKKIAVKIMAKVGSWFHFLGSVIGYFKYVKSQKH